MAIPFPALACLALAGLLSACVHVPGTKGAFAPVPADTAVIRDAAPRAPAETGRPLHCRVFHGAAQFGGKWADYGRTEFSLMPSARATVALPPARGTAEPALFQAWSDTAGQKMIFCPVAEGPPDRKIPCASLYALEEDLEAGIKRTFDIPGAVRGGMITCAYAREKLQD